MTDTYTRARAALETEAMMKHLANEMVETDRYARQDDKRNQEARAAAIRQEAERQS